MAAVGPEDSEVRIVVCGKQGHGKSTVGNALLGNQTFAVGTTTTEGLMAQTSKNGKTIKVVDTPDIYTDDWKQKTKKVEVERWKEMVAPEAHMLLLVVRGDQEYTEEDFKTYRQVRRFWGKGSAREKLLVVFTFCDGQPVNQVGNHMCETSPKWVGKILKDSGGRYLVLKGKSSGGLLDEVMCENDDASDDEEEEEEDEPEQQIQVVEQEAQEQEKKKRKQKKHRCRKPKGGRGRRLGLGDGKGRRRRRGGGGGGGGGLIGCVCSLLCCFCKGKGR